jgi:hypothetical protein
LCSTQSRQYGLAFAAKYLVFGAIEVTQSPSASVAAPGIAVGEAVAAGLVGGGGALLLTGGCVTVTVGAAGRVAVGSGAAVGCADVGGVATAGVAGADDRASGMLGRPAGAASDGGGGCGAALVGTGCAVAGAVVGTAGLAAACGDGAPIGVAPTSTTVARAAVELADAAVAEAGGLGAAATAVEAVVAAVATADGSACNSGGAVTVDTATGGTDAIAGAASEAAGVGVAGRPGSPQPAPARRHTANQAPHDHLAVPIGRRFYREASSRLPWITSSPPMYGLRTSGTRIEPSACWYVSMIEIIVLGMPRPDPFSSWGNSVPLPAAGR